MNRSPGFVWRHSLHRRSARQSITYEKAEERGSDIRRVARAAGELGTLTSSESTAAAAAFR